MPVPPIQRDYRDSGASGDGVVGGGPPVDPSGRAGLGVTLDSPGHHGLDRGFGGGVEFGNDRVDRGTPEDQIGRGEVEFRGRLCKPTKVCVDGVCAPRGYADALEDAVAARCSEIERRDVRDAGIHELKCRATRGVRGSVRGRLVQQGERCFRHAAILVASDNNGRATRPAPPRNRGGCPRDRERRTPVRLGPTGCRPCPPPTKRPNSCR